MAAEETNWDEIHFMVNSTASQELSLLKALVYDQISTDKHPRGKTAGPSYHGWGFSSSLNRSWYNNFRYGHTCKRRTMEEKNL